MKKALLFIGDLGIFYLSLVATLLLRYGNVAFTEHLGLHIAPFTILFALWVLMFYITQLYELETSKNDIAFYSLFFGVFATNALLSVLFFYFLPYFAIAPKTNLFIFLSVALLFLTLWRHNFNRLLLNSGFSNSTLIIGKNEQSEELFQFLQRRPQIGYNIYAILDVQDISTPEALRTRIIEKKIKTIVISPAIYRIPEIIHTLYSVRDLKVVFFSLPDFFEKVTGKIPLDAIDQVWFLNNLSFDSYHFYQLVKRIIDVTLALFLLAITLPFYPFVMLAIKLDSAGPLIYRQRRMGKSSKVFTLMKFRTMRQDAERGGHAWASENDTRSTRIGKLLRRTRIDELPQIINVLKGSMSFVGPRPERPEFRKQLTSEIPFYDERHLVTPGLTGWAQIKYKLDFQGGMTVHDTLQKVQYDLYYIKHRSVLLDIGILLQTANIIIKKVI